MRKVVNEYMTVGDLKEFLANNELPDDAFIWMDTDGSVGMSELVADVYADKMTTPDPGHPEEEGLIFRVDMNRGAFQ